MQTFANTGIKTEVIDEIISFSKKVAEIFLDQKKTTKNHYKTKPLNQTI